jgi:hypothetical protein
MTNIHGYLASDGRTVTTWEGQPLASVTLRSPVRLTRPSWVHGSSIDAVRAVTADGRRWYGRGSRGMSITLRACK